MSTAKAKVAKTLKTKTRKKTKRVVVAGIAHLQTSFGNTKIYITDLLGNTIAWATAGSMGFKGSRKATPYAALKAAAACAQAAINYGLKTLEIRVDGPGSGRESAIRELSNFFKILSISDVTGIPHNGCRKKKERRV